MKNGKINLVEVKVQLVVLSDVISNSRQKDSLHESKTILNLKTFEK